MAFVLIMAFSNRFVVMVGDAVVVVWYGFIGLFLDFPSKWWFLVFCWVCKGGLVVFGMGCG